MVWSYSATDPTDPTGAGAAQHNFAGSRSINLISGLPNGNSPPLENERSLAIEVSSVSKTVLFGCHNLLWCIIYKNRWLFQMLVATTYFCESFRLPPAFVNTTHYINRVSCCTISCYIIIIKGL